MFVFLFFFVRFVASVYMHVVVMNSDNGTNAEQKVQSHIRFLLLYQIVKYLAFVFQTNTHFFSLRFLAVPGTNTSTASCTFRTRITRTLCAAA
jgi:hypothetical protein